MKSTAPFFKVETADPNVAVTGDKDNRNVALTGDKVFLDFQTAHARHSDVKDENGDSVRIEFGEEHFTAFEKFNTVAGALRSHLRESRTASSSSTIYTTPAVSGDS